MSAFQSPLTGNAVDVGVGQLTNILAGSPADGVAVVSQLTTWLQQPAQQNEVLRQIISLYAMVKRTSAADLALVEAAKALVV